MNQQTAPTEGKTQDLRGFTAKVCRADKKAVIGTAFAVDRSEALLVTCKHVVRAASPDKPGQGARVWLYLPQLPEGSDKIRLARVTRCFDECDDDVMVLQLDPPELPAEMEVAGLGAAEGSVGFDELHKFRSFGYRRLENYQGLPAYGEIIDFVGKPVDRVLHGEPVMLKSQDIDGGMSGAAVLDLKRNLVVGVIAETWKSGRDFANRDTSFAVDGAVLNLPPLGLPLHDALPLAASPQPSEVEQAAARQAPAQSFPLKPAFHNAPPSLDQEWAGREEMLAGLTADWADPATRVAGLIGFGGEGKSSLARKWVGEMLAVPPVPPLGLSLHISRVSKEQTGV